MFCIIQLRTIPNTWAKNKIKYIENNYYLLGMHAVFMGTTTASTTPVVVTRHCRVIVFDKKEVVNNTGWWVQRQITSHDAGMTDTADVAELLHAHPTNDMLLFLGSFLNSCGCSTAKSKTPPPETICFTYLQVQSLGPNHPWLLVIENWFLF